MIEQISIYMENGKGATLRVLATLSQADINVLGFVCMDAGEFATLRLILDDTALGLETLKAAGYVCKADSVLGIELEDKPGALEALLAHIEDMNINIDYLYVGYARDGAVPLIMIHCGFADVVEDNLKRAGYRVR